MSVVGSEEVTAWKRHCKGNSIITKEVQENENRVDVYYKGGSVGDPWEEYDINNNMM